MNEALAFRLRASVNLQRLQDENELLLAALRQIAAVGSRCKIRNHTTGRHYYAMAAERAFLMAERVIDQLEGREPEFSVALLAKQITEAMTLNYPEAP